MNEQILGSGMISNICPKCNKPLEYYGNISNNGWGKGQEPYCTCLKQSLYNSWTYCPYCGKELK